MWLTLGALLAGCDTETEWLSVEPFEGGEVVSRLDREGGSEVTAWRTPPLAVGSWFRADLMRVHGTLATERIDVVAVPTSVVEVRHRLDGKDHVALELAVTGPGEGRVVPRGLRRDAGVPIEVIARRAEEARMTAFEVGGDRSRDLEPDEVLHALPEDELGVDVELLDEGGEALSGYDAVIATVGGDLSVRTESDGQRTLLYLDGLNPAPPEVVSVASGDGQALSRFQVHVHGFDEVEDFRVIVGSFAVTAEVDVAGGAVFAPMMETHTERSGWLRASSFAIGDGGPTTATLCLAGADLCEDVDLPGPIVPSDDANFWDALCGCSQGGRPGGAAGLALAFALLRRGRVPPRDRHKG